MAASRAGKYSTPERSKVIRLPSIKSGRSMTIETATNNGNEMSFRDVDTQNCTTNSLDTLDIS